MPNALDALTQYFALPDSAAGAQPYADPSASADPSLSQFMLPVPTSDPGMSVPSPKKGKGKSVADKLGALLASAPAVSNQSLSNQSLSQGAPAPAAPVLADGSGPALQALQNAPLIDQNGQPLPNVPQNMTPSGLSPMQQNGTASPDLPYPTLKRDKPTLGEKVFGILSNLSGGNGAQIINSYIQQKNANNQQDFNQQAAQRQDALQQQQAAQRQQQQQQNDDYAHAQAAQGLLKNMSGYDDATQKSTIDNLISNPTLAATYGMTPDQLKAQFYDADGAFQPVTGADDAKSTAALLRAQTGAQRSLHALTPQAQQAMHDSMSADDFESEFGIPYDGFAPGQNAGDLTRQENADTAKQRVLTAGQQKSLTTFLNMSPAMQTALLHGLTPSQKAAQFGTANLVPGMKESDRQRLLSSDNQKAEADQRNQTQQRGQNLTHGDRLLSLDLEKRGQDLREQSSEAAQRDRETAFTLHYGLKGGTAPAQQFDALMKQRAAIQKRMTQLSAPDKTLGGTGVSARDEGRIDMDATLPDPNGGTDSSGLPLTVPNPHYGQPIPNAPVTAAYREYMWLQQQDKALNNQQFALLHPPAAGGSAEAFTVRPGTPHGGSLVPPGTIVTPAQDGPIPGTTVRPGSPPVPQYSPSINALQRHLGASVPPQPAHASQPPNTSPRTSVSGGQPQGVSVLSGTLGGQPFTFHAPRTQAEFAALTPAKRQAYVTYLRQKNTAFR